MSTAAEHWDNWHKSRKKGIYVDWADHPFVYRKICEENFGSPEINIIRFIQMQLPNLSKANVLSLGCGDGMFEFDMLKSEVFGHVTGFDISAARVDAGNLFFKENKNDKFGNIRLVCKDLNSDDYGDAEYDIVFAKSSLHHIEHLEHAFFQIKKCLKPGGKLVTVDFFGPTRFQWTDTQLAMRAWFWEHCVPDSIKVDTNGVKVPEICRPSLQDMIDLDPSEAVRSGDLYALMHQNFEFETDVGLGGSLMNLLLYGEIVNIFDPSLPEHNAILLKAYELEKTLIKNKILNHDFRLIVAKPRIEKKKGLLHRIFS